MSPERRAAPPGDRMRRFEEALNAALDAPPEERASVLEAVCADDLDLLSEVRDLILSHEAASDYFDGLAGEVSRSSADELLSAHPGEERIGPYRLRDEIGRGGMGTVYLAERADGQFDQEVALKLVRRGRDGSWRMERFLAERQILARLEHPSIARLLDGGVSAAGQPYFVMERVVGEPITEFCDRKRLSVRERLRFFRAVGEAVQYAHGQLVVHRDLKPSNILVTPGGACKLLDFGIAKVLESAEDTGRAEDEPVAASLPYAAPEHLLGDPVGAAADVYSLGVLLFELLSGRRPAPEPAGSNDDFEALVRRRERASLPGAVDPEAARGRGAAPASLRRLLSGDLEAVCRRALGADPSSRYPSVAQLVEDVDRWLAHLPVQARRSGVFRRAWKLSRRNPVAVAAAASIVALSFGFGVVNALQSRRVARERDKAQQVTALLVDIFEVADPSEARGESVTAREILDRGVEELRQRVADDPQVRAGLLDVLGRVYRNLGLFASASALLDESLELRRGAGAPDLEIAENLVSSGEVLRLLGDLESAEERLRSAIATYEDRGADGRVGLALGLDRLGLTLLARGRADDAETLFLRSLALHRASLGDRHELVATNLQNLGAVEYARGDFSSAEERFREALEMRRGILGRDHPQVAASLNNLAAALARKGETAAAASTWEDVLELQRRLFGEQHPRFATTLGNLGMTLFSAGDAVAAEPLLREALAVRREALGPRHPDVAESLANLGLVLQALDRPREAEAAYREGIEILEAAFGHEHAAVAQGLNNLGLSRQASGDFAGAEDLFREGLRILRAILGDEHPRIATTLNNLASTLHATGRLVEAEATYREALAMRRKLLPVGHPHLAYNLLGLGRLLGELGRQAEAEPLLLEALEIRMVANGEGHREVEEARQALAENQRRSGRVAEASVLSTR